MLKKLIALMIVGLLLGQQAQAMDADATGLDGITFTFDDDDESKGAKANDVRNPLLTAAADRSYDDHEKAVHSLGDSRTLISLLEEGNFSKACEFINDNTSEVGAYTAEEKTVIFATASAALATMHNTVATTPAGEFSQLAVDGNNVAATHFFTCYYKHIEPYNEEKHGTAWWETT